MVVEPMSEQTWKTAVVSPAQSRAAPEVARALLKIGDELIVEDAREGSGDRAFWVERPRWMANGVARTGLAGCGWSFGTNYDQGERRLSLSHYGPSGHAEPKPRSPSVLPESNRHGIRAS